MTGTLRHLSRRACMAVAAFVLAAAPLVLAAPSAHAAPKGFDKTPSTTPGTVNCMSSEDRDINYPGACDQITPSLSCVWDNQDGTFSAALGFNNTSGYTLILPAGSYENSIYGNGKDGSDVGQTSSFRPGISETEFVVTWDAKHSGDDVQWELGANPNVSPLHFSSTTTPACAAHPVPIMGSTTVLGISVGVAAVALLWWNRRSLRRKEWIRALGRH